MKNKNQTDERILTLRRKINSESYLVGMALLFVSILVQDLLLKAPFQQYAAELICFLALSLYTIIRSWMLGLDISGKSQKHTDRLLSMGIGLIVTVAGGISNYMAYGDHYRQDGIGYFIAVLAFLFVSASIFSFMILVFLGSINRQRQKAIQKRLDNEEKEE